MGRVYTANERHGAHLPEHAHAEGGKEAVPMACCPHVEVQILKLRFKASCSPYFLHFHLQQPLPGLGQCRKRRWFSASFILCKDL